MVKNAMLTMMLLVGYSLAPVPVFAGTASLGLSGTFAWQYYEMVPGTSMSSPAVYIIVQNNGTTPLVINMLTEVPNGVKILFSEASFTLESGRSQKVDLTVEVGEDAIPGQYELGISAEAYGGSDEEGLHLTGAVGQEATLIVSTEAARVIVQAVRSDGDPAITEVYLVKEKDGHRSQAGYSPTGRLEATITPGRYLATTVGPQSAEKAFEITADEDKAVELPVDGRVTTIPETTETPNPGTGFNWLLTGGIVGGLIIAGLLFVLMKYRVVGK